MDDCINSLKGIDLFFIDLYPAEEERLLLEAKLKDKKRLEKKSITKFFQKDDRQSDKKMEAERLEAIRTKLSDEFVSRYVKCMNSVLDNGGFKTVIDARIKKTPFYIIIYSKQPLSNREAYAISTSYRERFGSMDNPEPSKSHFIEYLRWCYPEVKEIESRIKLYEYYNKDLIIVLDVNPQDVGLNTSVIELTRVFNEEVDKGKYKTVIKAGIHYNIIIYSNMVISIEEVQNIKRSYQKINRFGTCLGEEGAIKFLDVIGKIRKIKSHDGHSGSFTIEFE